MKRQATATSGKTGRICRTVKARRERYPRKARRAQFLLVDIGKVQAECEAIASLLWAPVCSYPKSIPAKWPPGSEAARWKERAETWKQRELKVQLWLHWEQGGFLEAKALLVKQDREGQQDFFGLL